MNLSVSVQVTGIIILIPSFSIMVESYPTQGYITDVLTNEAIAFIEKNKAQPSEMHDLTKEMSEKFDSLKLSYDHWYRDIADHYQALGDSIWWNIEVVDPGTYHVSLQYTCPISDLGSTVTASIGNQQLSGKVL